MKAKRYGRGQSLVEFALILPLLMILLIAFIEFARVIYYYSALTNAVREGARYATVNQFADNADREAKVGQVVVDYAIALPLNLADVSVYCNRTPGNTPNTPCDRHVTVAADMEIEPMVGFFAQLIGAGTTYDITAHSTMQMTPYGAYDD